MSDGNYLSLRRSRKRSSGGSADGCGDDSTSRWGACGAPPVPVCATKYTQPRWGVTTGAVSLFVLASVVYIGGLCPTIYWADSPEFVTTAHTLGISHPAGSPTYSLMAKLVTLMPLGSVALRINAFSALVGVLTLSLLFMLLYALLAPAAPWIRWLAAWIGPLFLLVSESFWRFAEVAEVYSLQNGFLVLTLTLLLKSRGSTPLLQRRYYWGFALLYGLSTGVHVTMVLFIPAFLGFIVLTTPRLLRLRELAFVVFFLMLGCATYLYLPIRSLTEPAFNWGEPHTWRQFLIHISDRKDAAVHTVFLVRQLPYQIYMYVLHLTNEFSYLGVALGLLGFLAVFRKDKPLWFVLTAALLGHTAFFIRTWWDTAWGFMPSFVIFALWIGLGTHVCLEWLKTLYQRDMLHIPRVIVYTFFLGGMTIVIGQTLVRHAAHQATNYATEQYGKLLLAQLPPDAILFCQSSWFPLVYLQEVEKQRPDLTFILQGAVFSPEHFSLVSTKRFPNIQQVTSAQSRTVSTANYFWRLAQLNAQHHALFWDPDTQFQEGFSTYLLPQGLLFTFDPMRKREMTSEVLRAHWKLLSHTLNRILQESLEDFTTLFLSNKLNVIAEHFRHIGSIDESAKMFQTALSIRPDDTHANNNYGTLLMSQGELSEALERFNLAYDQAPIDPIINKNLGLLMTRVGDAAQAVYFFERALAFGIDEGDAYVQLSEAYAALGRLSPALEVLRLALQQYRKQTPENAADAKLQEKITLVQTLISRLESQGQVGPPTR